MKIAFIIDKTQTIQIIIKVLKESLVRNYDCTVFCCFEKEKLGMMNNYLGKYLDNVKWINNQNRNHIINILVENRQSYDCVIGINFFNKSLKKVFENNNTANYGLEYCWNEIYNQQSKFKSQGTLFCNSENTKKIIQDLSNYHKVNFVGSPWFEYLTENKTLNKEKKIVFMAPHNSFYSAKSNLREYVKIFLNNLRHFSDKNGYELILKTRSKYSNEEKRYIKFDEIYSDKVAGNHIQIYKDACLVINFCSSAINELSFLQVPYLIIGPEVQKDLHTDMSCDAGIKKIHDVFYNGSIIDGIHCDSHTLDNNIDFDVLNFKIENLIKSKKNWNNFQEAHFSGNHAGASSRILDIIKNETTKKNSNIS